MNDEQPATVVLREKESLRTNRNTEQKAKRKDHWDKLAILLPFVSGVLVSSVGLYFTVSYNRQANRIAELQMMERFIPQLTGTEETKRLARQVISVVGDPKMQKALAEISREGTDQQRRIAKATLGATAIAIFDNTNIDAVENGGQFPVFTIARAHLIANIWNYHWNNGRGATPGTISLRRDDGSRFGPWEVIATSGQGGAPNVNWECNPNVTIPAGTYTVIDSDAATWSQNPMSKGMGFSRVRGIPIDNVN